MMAEEFIRKCFVCEEPVNADCFRNEQINLPVCEKCKGSEKEALAVQQLLEGMADGFVCGCI